MTEFLNKIAILIFFITTVFNCFAAEKEDSVISCPVTGIYSLEFGRKQVLATYLSPLTYSGIDYGVSGEWSKAMPFNPEKVLMRFRLGGNFSNLLNPAHTARMIGLNGYFSWGMAWRNKLGAKGQWTLGGAIEMAGGAYYLLRNGNNPVQAMADLSLDINAGISYPFRLGKLNLLVADNVSLPSLGVFFNPQYGETYYEIYLGNHKGLAHAGWWGNNFSVDNLLSVTFDFGRTAAMIGYRLNAWNQWANCLNTRIITHSFVIGIIPGGIGLKKSKPRNISSTLYSVY